MDEELVNGPARLEVVVEGLQHQTKDEEYSLNPDQVSKSKDYDQNDSSHVPPREYNEIRQGASSQVLHPSQFLDDAGDMVEELTLRSYNGSCLEIGTMSSRGPMYNRQRQWQLASDSGMRNSVVHTGCRNIDQTAESSILEDFRFTTFPEMLAGKSLSVDQRNITEHLTTVEQKAEPKDDQRDAHGRVWTKIVSNFGFAEYFIKNTLKEKGIVCTGTSSNGLSVEHNDHNQIKVSNGTQMDSSVSMSSDSKITKFPCNAPFPRCRGSDFYGVTLREWLKAGKGNRSKAERLNIFRKIVELVDATHSQGFALHNLNPSYIKLLPSNQVMYLGLQKLMSHRGANSEGLQLENSFTRKRMSEQVTSPPQHMWSKKQKFNEKNVKVVGEQRKCPPRSDLYQGARESKFGDVIGSHDYCKQYKDIQLSKNNIERMSSIPCTSSGSQMQLASLSEIWEDKWYTSPEGGCSTSSNIYCLGVLFFELLGHFDSERAHIAAMSNLRCRILPPVFLSENHEEARLCIQLLHPEPTSRPTTREILQEVINGIHEVCSEGLSLQIDQEDAESELLLHFLLFLQEKKNKVAFKLEEKVRFLESDIQEVERKYSSIKSSVSSGLHNTTFCQNEIAFLQKETSCSKTILPLNAKETVMRNLCQLESAYFSMRYKLQIPETNTATRPDKDTLRYHENWSVSQKGKEQQKTLDTRGAFFDGFLKYARYSKFEVRGVLRNSDFNNLGYVISSLSFDRDEEYLAAAGMSKKIKIFEFYRLINDSVHFHHPVVEMSNRSKLSCVCWNSYIKNYLASTDYDGVVKLWDAITGRVFSQFTEHKKRAWSVDFSPVYPTKLASASDDYSVKLWSINEVSFF